MAQYEKTEKQKETSHLPGAVLVLIVMLLFGGLGRRSGKGGGILPWLVVGSMLGSGRRSSSGFGGGFGGGFSGGGGGFGGGGASGGW